MVHGVKAMLDIHLKWVVLYVDVWNVFNSISQVAIFKKSWSSIGTLDQLSHLFIGFMHTHLHYIFSKVFKHGDFIVISFEFGTR
jgi:hypothetical protein